MGEQARLGVDKTYLTSAKSGLCKSENYGLKQTLTQGSSSADREQIHCLVLSNTPGDLISLAPVRDYSAFKEYLRLACCPSRPR